MARWSAMVSVHPHRHPCTTPAWDHHPARIAARFEGLRPILLVYPVAFFAVFLRTGLPEEIGWRGFALPRMQPRYGPLRGTLLLGVLWGFWYSSYFLTAGSRRKPRHQFLYRPYGLSHFSYDGHSNRNNNDVGFQPHSRKRLHRQRAAHQHQYPGSCVDTTVSPRE